MPSSSPLSLSRAPRRRPGRGACVAVLVAALGCATAKPEAPGGTGEASATTPAAAEPPATPAEERSRARLDAHLDFLADDLLAGRVTGTAEYEIAARYVAAQLQAMGLAPIPGSDYLLPVPLRASRLEPESAVFELLAGGERQRLEWGEHFVMTADPTRQESDVEGEVVYVGYGVSAPEHGWDDYAGLDVRGKVLLQARGTPASLPHDERAFHSTQKAAVAAKHGAVGIVTFRGAGDYGPAWDRVVANNGRQPQMDWLDPQGNPSESYPGLLGHARLGPEGLAALLGAAGRDPEATLEALSDGKPQRGPLGVRVRLASRSRHEAVASSNVAAILPGSDPSRRGEVVVLSAHLDHVTGAADAAGDAIHNGYYDNAMGVSLLLEAARAFAEAPRAPRRTLVFLAVTAEERGLLGSDHFASHPPAGLGRMVANVNLDMPLFLHPVADLVAFGAEHSTLEGLVAKAAAEAGFGVSPDPFPDEVIFVRSDQYSFVRKGIPAVFLVTGFGSRDAGRGGAAVYREFLDKHYHQPSDQASLPVDWPSALRFLRANVLLARAIADAPEPPAWKEGDFFGRTFGGVAAGS